MILAISQQLVGLYHHRHLFRLMCFIRESHAVDQDRMLIPTDFFSLAGLADPFLGSRHSLVSYTTDPNTLPRAPNSLTQAPGCCNLLAVTLWSFSADKFGRRTIINTCQNPCLRDSLRCWWSLLDEARRTVTLPPALLSVRLPILADLISLSFL